MLTHHAQGSDLGSYHWEKKRIFLSSEVLTETVWVFLMIGAVGKSACHCKPEPHGGRREMTPECCPLTSTWMSWHVHRHTNKNLRKQKDWVNTCAWRSTWSLVMVSSVVLWGTVRQSHLHSLWATDIPVTHVEVQNLVKIILSYRESSKQAWMDYWDSLSKNKNEHKARLGDLYPVIPAHWSWGRRIALSLRPCLKKKSCGLERWLSD